jgi:hypothetical protein
MDALEALSILHAKRGYLILGTQFPRTVGEVVGESASAWHASESGEIQHERINQPVVIIGEANREEFLEQDRLLRRFLGGLPDGRVSSRYFYRVAAKD